MHVLQMQTNARNELNCNCVDILKRWHFNLSQVRETYCVSDILCIVKKGSSSLNKQIQKSSLINKQIYNTKFIPATFFGKVSKIWDASSGPT